MNGKKVFYLFASIPGILSGCAPPPPVGPGLMGPFGGWLVLAVIIGGGLFLWNRLQPLQRRPLQEDVLFSLERRLGEIEKRLERLEKRMEVGQ